MPKAKRDTKRQSTASKRSNKRVKEHRGRLRAAGLRPVQLWVWDTTRPGFAEQVRREHQGRLEWVARWLHEFGWTFDQLPSYLAREVPFLADRGGEALRALVAACILDHDDIATLALSIEGLKRALAHAADPSQDPALLPAGLPEPVINPRALWHPVHRSRRRVAELFDLPCFPAYDPAWRFHARIEEAEPKVLDVETGTDGIVHFDRLGVVQVPGVGSLDVWKHGGYAGGLFVPVKDASAGKPGGTYGGGRYLIDTIKGSDLGDTDGELVLDFNFAYNPSCAYDPAWACPLAPPGNTLPVAVPVGERYGS